MRDILTNKLGSFQSTLAVADEPENQPIWQNQPPQAFSDGLALARTAVAGLATTGAAQSLPTTGSTAALKALRGQFTTALLPLARATFQCLTSLGRTEDAAKVDVTGSHLHDARAVALAGIGETVLDLAEPLSTATGSQSAAGDKYGVTADKVSAMDALWQKYSTAVGAPVGARAKRKAMSNQLPGQFAGVEQQFSALDDLVIQFRGTPAGDLFVDAWFNARHVVDLGHHTTHPASAPAPATPTTGTK
ncbi:MAG TPA: hypothetical protein VMD27_12735 [Candidatus Aquilonibacter sp.]|nr:hypothetical protein [Candidatus Aquilonibacter sp.]